MSFEKIISWLGKSENITILHSVSACVIGVAALIVSIISARFVGQQTRINKALYQLQVETQQPFFIINTQLQKDADDEKYGTEHLVVKNTGFPNVFSKVDYIVLFELTRFRDHRRDSVYVRVDDYFFVTQSGDPDENIIYHAYDVGNNRKFFDLYMQALMDKSDDSFYALNKIILVQIDYKDTQKLNHTKYYINKEEVDKQEYNNILSKIRGESYRLDALTFDGIKALFEK